MFHYIQKFKWHNALLFVIILFWAGINVVSSLVLTWLLDAIIDGKWQTVDIAEGIRLYNTGFPNAEMRAFLK